MNQKALHKHALPVILLGVGLLFVAGLVIVRMGGANTANQNLTQLLTARLFTIKPAANGLFHITRYRDAGAQANLSSLGNQVNSLNMMNDAGRVAQIDAVVKGTN